MSRWLKYCFFTILFIALSLLILLAAKGTNSEYFEEFFPILVAINTVAATILFGVVIHLSIRLYRHWKHKHFGYRMMTRLALTIAVTAIVPCVFLYIISSQVVGRSIDSWFDTRIEKALESGIELSRQIINREQELLQISAERIKENLAHLPKNKWESAMADLLIQDEVDQIIVLDHKQTIVAKVINSEKQSKFFPPLKEDLDCAFSQQPVSRLEGDVSVRTDHLNIWTLVSLNPGNRIEKTEFLYLSKQIPKLLAKGATDLVAGYRSNHELRLTRNTLATTYQITLLLTMLMAVFGALTLAIYYAHKTTEPVLQLALGTRKVAQGRLQHIVEHPGDNELSDLTLSFNSMVTQIADARQSVENQRVVAEHSRLYLRHILENISTGVMVLSNELDILTVSESLNKLLSPLKFNEADSLNTVAPEIAKLISGKIQVADNGKFQTNFDFTSANSLSPTPIFIQGSRLSIDGVPGCWVVVFDDMTSIIDAQKAVAWAEVARRLAHEIKNPLTPIRLAAERLEFKLKDKLDEKDAAILLRTSKTIIAQVDAMKQMVNDFREYAKLPSPTFKHIDINPLVEEMIDFYSTSGVTIKYDLAADLPKIEADHNQLQQVLHNLIGNAVDATENSLEPEIQISTEPVRRVYNNTIKSIRLTIRDNGTGFPEHLLKKIFEPYVTTKTSGTGLGLPMVKKIIKEHHGKITIANRTDTQGAEVAIVIPVALSAESST